MLHKLNVLNKIEIYNIENEKFKRYGKILKDYEVNEIITYMEKESKIPNVGNVYHASIPSMECMDISKIIEKSIYGEMDIQVGYCNGNNSFLNGLEYHKGSEVNIAVTDLVLLLGHVYDIRENVYLSENIEAFYLPKGSIVELYQSTLHFAPCKVSNNGFKCVVILPKGTNTPLKDKNIEYDLENKLLFMKNKWLLVHPSKTELIKKGAYPGIIGENVEIKYK